VKLLFVGLVVGAPPLLLLAVAHERQFTPLVVYELLVALPLLLLFTLRIARPVERLAEAARRYPALPLADPQLLARNDEIATLARILSTMAADLERRRQQAADLGADMAHEFKGPLASLAAASEMLGSGKTFAPERLALIAATVAQAVERLHRSLDELLSLLRLEQAVPAEGREVVDYPAFVDELLADYRRDPRHAGWTFRLERADRLTLALNRHRWAELLRNLIDNALVQPTARQEIVVAIRRDASAVITTVRDHGPGVSAENRTRIFRRFYSDRPPGVPPGTGLGLSVVETIARAHGAHLELTCPPGQGAHFSVVLPHSP
jgi:signal transduction histidine kinase